MRTKYLTALLLCLIISCVQKTECNIIPIEKSVLDTHVLPSYLVFVNQKGSKDSLILSDKFDDLNNQTVRGIANHVECSHTIGYKFDSSLGNGNIWVRIDKDNQSKYNVLINGLCFDYEVLMTEQEIGNENNIEIRVDNCKESNFKKLIFRKFLLQSYTTQNGDSWHLLQR